MEEDYQDKKKDYKQNKCANMKVSNKVNKKMEDAVTKGSAQYFDYYKTILFLNLSN